jgi:hypothetical protein
MKKNYILLSAIFCSLVSFQAQAYEVTVPIQNRSKSTLQSGFQDGAKKLILRLTASDQATTALASDLKHARSWVDEYTTTSNPDNADQPWLLNATYSNRRVQQLLKQHQLNSWKKTPPTVYLLLKTADGGALQENDPRWQSLHNAAIDRGFSFQRINQAPNTLTAHGKPIELVIGVIPDPNSDDPDTTISWSWYHQAQWQQWQQTKNEQWESSTASNIGQQLMQTQPQQEISNLTPIRLQINGIQDFSDYTQAIQALRKLRGIQGMTDNGIQGDKLLITLVTKNSISDTKQALDNIQGMHAQLNMPIDAVGTDLNYSWGEQSQTEERLSALDMNYREAPLASTTDSQPTVDEESFAYDNAYSQDNPL